jgi:alanine racemase
VDNLDMVRCGNLIYGITDNVLNNKLVISITSKIINIIDVKRGDSVGYDRLFIADKSRKIGIVPLGYADGIDRRLSNKFYVIINDCKCKIIGYICMDTFMVDLDGVDVEIGDKVILLGEENGQKITLFDYAKTLNTSPYEVLLKFNSRRMNYLIKE